jgi:hypothetical protein
VFFSQAWQHSLLRLDVNGDLNGFFNNLGYSGNVTQAQAWQGQAAGTSPAALSTSGTPSKTSS